MRPRLLPKSMRIEARWFQISLVAIILSMVVVIEYLMVAGSISVVSGMLLLTQMLGAALIAAMWMRHATTNLEVARKHHAHEVTSFANLATDLYWETDTTGQIESMGGRLMASLLMKPTDLIGQHYLKVIDMEANEDRRMQTALRALQPYSDIQSRFHDRDGQVYYLSLNGTPKRDEDGRIIGYLGMATNVTERVINARKLKHIAEHDMLTGLANRYRFSQQIRDDVKAVGRNGCLALLAIDLDGFKTVNDTLGHQAGDALLNLVGKRLRGLIRSCDWAARMGGDEFVVVSRDVKSPLEACLLASRLVAKLAEPYRIGGSEVEVSASIGIACTPIHAKSSDLLMKCADIALYQAKAAGKNGFQLYNEAIAASDAA